MAIFKKQFYKQDNNQNYFSSNINFSVANYPLIASFKELFILLILMNLIFQLYEAKIGIILLQ